MKSWFHLRQILPVVLASISVQVRCRAHTSRKPLDINRSKEAHFFSSRGRSELFTAELSAVGGAREKHKQTFPLIIGSRVVMFQIKKMTEHFLPVRLATEDHRLSL